MSSITYKNSVLLLSPFFYPEQISTGKYNTALAKALVERSISVRVIASYPLYPEWKPEVCSASLDDIVIHRAGESIHYPKSPYLRRFFLETWFAWHATVKSWRYRANTQYVVPIFPPSLFFLFVDFILPRSVRRVGIVHDLQGIYAARSRSFALHLVSLTIRLVERRVFRRCDKLIFLSSSMRDSAIKVYKLDALKCVVCYPFVALPASTEFGVLDSIFPVNMRHVVYSGALGEKQNSDELVNFMEALSISCSDVACHIFSGGPIFENLKKVQQSKGGKIKFHSLVAEEHLMELYTRSDVQIIPQAPDTANGSLPSKLPNLLFAGTPIFAICDDDSELAKLIRNFDAGFVSSSWTQENLLADMEGFLESLCNQNRSQRIFRNKLFLQSSFTVDQVISEIFELPSTPASAT